MAELVALGDLNKSSARLVTFVVRLAGGRVTDYEYQSKKTETAVQGHKSEVCVGFVKGSEVACKKAASTYKDGTVWALSKAALDTYPAITYISTPLPFRIDLGKSTMTARNSDEPADKELQNKRPSYPIPPHTVADVSRITTNRSTDLIAMIKSWSEKRVTKAGHDVVDVELIDNSEKTPGKFATVMVLSLIHI